MHTVTSIYRSINIGTIFSTIWKYQLFINCHKQSMFLTLNLTFKYVVKSLPALAPIYLIFITVLVLNVIIITFTKIFRNYILYYCMEILTRHLGNSLHRLLNCEIGGLDGRVITSTTEYRTNDQCIQTLTRHSWIHYTDCWIVK